MQDARQALAGDAVKHRKHEHQALRGGKTRRKRACLQRPVHGGSRAGFGLHLDQPDRLSEHVLLSLCGPHVRLARHRRGGRDGIDRGDLGERVSHIGRRFFSVHRHIVSGLFTHSKPPARSSCVLPLSS